MVGEKVKYASNIRASGRWSPAFVDSTMTRVVRGAPRVSCPGESSSGGGEGNIRP